VAPAPFWYRLTRVVADIGRLTGVVVAAAVAVVFYLIKFVAFFPFHFAATKFFPVNDKAAHKAP